MEAEGDDPFLLAANPPGGARMFLHFLQRMIFPGQLPAREQACLAATWLHHQAERREPAQLLSVQPSEELEWIVANEEPAPWRERVKEWEEKWGEG